MKSICITGATGVIGMALINKFIEEKIHVYALVNPGSNRVSRIPENEYVTVVPCSIDDYNSFSLIGEDLEGEIATSKCREGADNKHLEILDINVFYHLAWAGTFGEARNDATMQQKNVEYTLDAVRLAKKLGCRTFVGVGSQAEYGRVSGILKDDTPCNPENEYGKAKLLAGQESRKLASELGIKHIWTRVLSIYGPYDGKDTMITSTINKLLTGEVPSLTKGEQVWDYLYSKDAANALYLLGFGGSDNLGGIDGKIYPIGSGIAMPLREYIEIMRNAIDPKLELGFGQRPYVDKQVMYLCADISNLKNDVGFEPEYSFEEGIKETIEFLSNS